METNKTIIAIDQKGFEDWATKHGGLPITAAYEMTCGNGWFPATYHNAMTEIAWRAWANKAVLNNTQAEASLARLVEGVEGLRAAGEYEINLDVACMIDRVLAFLPVKAEDSNGMPPQDMASRMQRLGKHVMEFATKGGWKDDGEGAFEFIQRQSYAVGISDAGKTPPSGPRWGNRWPIDQLEPAATQPITAPVGSEQEKKLTEVLQECTAWLSEHEKSLTSNRPFIWNALQCNALRWKLHYVSLEQQKKT